MDVERDNDPLMPGDADYIGAIAELARMGKTNGRFREGQWGRHLSFLKLDRWRPWYRERRGDSQPVPVELCAAGIENMACTD